MEGKEHVFESQRFSLHLSNKLSDAHCPCAPGYKTLEDGRRRCVRQVYDICRDSTSRNQEGQCLTKKEWMHYCTNKVCARPEDYQGYDKVLGLCVCRADNLNSVCNSQCRRQQRDILQFVCKGKNAQLSLTYRNGSQIAIFLEQLKAVLQVLHSPAKNPCPTEHSTSSYPVYMVKTSGKGFLGVYNPDPELLHNLIVPNKISSPDKSVPLSAAAPGKTGKEDPQFYWAQSQRPSNSTLQIPFTGILNPTTCIYSNVTIIFIVSKEHYPVYDVNNLYNTNNEFDWGGFRSLAEEIKLASTNILLFLYQFEHPGTYVLGLSSNQHKKMYVRVMPHGGQCYEDGPFFPTTPRHVIQVGIARIPNLLLKPDWPAIIGLITGLLIFLITCLLLILLCQDLGWSKEGNTCPLFRRLQLKYNLDKYSSKGSTVISVKKCHPRLKNKGSLDKNYGNSDETEAFFLETGEIWESEEQINLDSFNTNVFFEILLTQSLSVTAKLSQFKEELKILYHKLMTEIASLRELWIMRLCISEKAESYDSIMMGNYMKAKYQAEEEMLHRKQLAAEYDEIVNKQLHLLHHDLKCQEEHCVLFKSALREAVRLAEVLTEKMACGGNRAMWSKPDYQWLLSQIDAASNRMSSAVIKESHRLKAWGVLGDGTGAHLINKDKTRLLTKEELLDSDGCVRAPDTIYMDPITGLLTPNPDCVTLLVNHCPMPVSRDQFLHPETGKVLPVAGNVGYDPVSSKLISAVDSASGELCKSEVPIFPYVPYPISPRTGLPVKTKLPSLQPDRVFKLGGLMLDPATEIEVPVLGVTIHPQTGQKLSLGGTYMNPLTGTVTPLEIGGPMIEPEGGKIVPILGVSLDNNTGDLVPVGGLMGPSGSLLLLGDSFSEPLSRKTARIHGACLKQDKVLPHAGGYQALLEANTLVTQIHVVKALRQYKDSICEDMSLAADKREVLKAAVEDMKKSLSIRLHHAIYRLQSLEKQHEIASSLKSNGGKLGIIKYPGTEMWIPAVFGMKIPDPGGSDLMVPILGVECDWNTGHPTPLAGTMEDADGKGLVPITVGARTIDPITGETGPVIGAQTDPWTNIVIPIVQSLGALPRGAADPDLLSILEKEINSRQMYWHRQREREEELLKELNFIFLDVLDAVKEGKAQKIRYKDKLKDIEETCHFLEESSLQEAQRRTARDLSRLLGSELSLLSKAERDEKEQEVRVILVIRKALEKMVQFIQKMQLEEGRLQRQMKEKVWQRSKNFNTETAPKFKPRKVILHHVAEFQEHIMKQQVNVESAYSRLEYLRDLLDIQALQAKALLSGTSQCFENYQGTRFYGIAGVPHSTWAVIHRKLIPLLKSLVQTLEENKRSDRSFETLILQSGKDDDKAKYMKSSPLLTLLKDVNDQLQGHAMAVGFLKSHLQEKDTGSPFQDILDALMTHKGELIPVHPPTLSAREFVIYQYGISILEFLRPHINAPEINLCVASSIPLSNTTGNAFQNSFFYQISEKKLFILREYLGCVGSFILLLVHCLAHITAADLSHDSSPTFQRLFYQALKACLSEMFSLRLRMSAVLQDNKSSVKISEILLKGEPFSEEKLNLISQLLDAKVKSAREMEMSEERNRNLLLHTNLEDLLKNKLSVKKKECFTHTSAGRKENSFGLRTSPEEESCSYFSLSEMEDQLDTLTEELVKVIEEEHFLMYAASEDFLFGLKKDCLVKQIEILEGKIAKAEKCLNNINRKEKNW
ncbi:uncharacterized protein LOC120375904 [Mauremys reevesii]|uniref:uncharacterized protein LOC120375904 n=1 Tax=Mauremys reevesii TaxID=260615 RepID=UPI00193F5259|nr:uncharacterized protein LOC120375904 [Mauremys reevesii]